MKKTFQKILIACFVLCFGTTTPLLGYSPRPVFLPLKTATSQIAGDIAGLCLTVITTLISGIKLINTFTKRHDYAHNFITDSAIIKNYTIKTEASSARWNSVRSTTVMSATFTSNSYQEIVEKCCAWEREVEPLLRITLHPSLSLHSGESYKLKRLQFKGKKQRAFLKEKINALFEIPTPNKWTYKKKAVFWSIPLGLSVYGVCKFSLSLRSTYRAWQSLLAFASTVIMLARSS